MKPSRKVFSVMGLRSIILESKLAARCLSRCVPKPGNSGVGASSNCAIGLSSALPPDEPCQKQLGVLRMSVTLTSDLMKYETALPQAGASAVLCIILNCNKTMKSFYCLRQMPQMPSNYAWHVQILYVRMPPISCGAPNAGSIRRIKPFPKWFYCILV